MSGPAEGSLAPSGAAGEILVIGCGLIGASAGMALVGAGHRVWLSDRDPDALRVAAALGAGDPVGTWPVSIPPAHREISVVVVAVPPAATAEVCFEASRLYPESTVIHVASVQAQPRAEIEALGPESERIVGTHPMAGRERSGPSAGSAALFRDRPWVVCPDGCTPSAVVAAHSVIRACGAYPVPMSASAHDDAVALVSHLPQLVASTVAGELTDAAGEAIALAGTGIRDLTRIADGDPAMWREIIGFNAPAVRSHLAALHAALGGLLMALQGPDPGPAVADVVERGRRGRERLGGKHGAGQRHWAAVQVVIEDRPGTLVAVLAACRDLSVNVEDISVDHVPGHPVGILELLVDPAVAASLGEALQDSGWEVAGVAMPHE